MNVAELLASARRGSLRSTGRLLTLVEGPNREEVLAGLNAGWSGARVVGVTGPPGAGKSTTVGALVGAYRQRGLRVAVLAVDPSSPYSGGALLGDRIRVSAHATDPDVLIRSLAARGHVGGLAAAVPAAVRVLDALSYDLIVLETVGVGQSEIEVTVLPDPTIVVLAPGAGTRSKRPRRAFWRSPTCWWSTSLTATAPSRPSVTCAPRPASRSCPWSLRGGKAYLPAHGMNVDSLAGVAPTTTVDGLPAFVPTIYAGIANEAAGQNAAVAVCAALLRARTVGEGAWVEVSCWDALVEANRMAFSYQLATGRELNAAIAPEIWTARHSLYRTADEGLIHFAAVERRSWERFCREVGRDDLLHRDRSAGDVDFGDDRLYNDLAAVFRLRTAAEWADAFVAWEIPGSPVLAVGDVIGSAHFAARGMVAGGSGAVPRIASAIRWVEQDTRAGATPKEPPALGVDTVEVVAHRWSTPSRGTAHSPTR